VSHASALDTANEFAIKRAGAGLALAADARSRGPVSPPGAGFVFIGRLSAEKGVSRLVAAWARSRVRDTQRFVVVGDGPERDTVIAAAETNVRYEGLVGVDRVRQLLDEAAIIVIPSLWDEGFPRVVAEAFERGRPIGSTALSSLRDLVSPDVGWTADPNPDASAAMLSTAAFDPALATKGAATRQVFEEYLTPEHSMQRLLDNYAEVTAAANQQWRTPGNRDVR
jgi:glycosyltransferase involved in cell wall biosynthesis